MDSHLLLCTHTHSKAEWQQKCIRSASRIWSIHEPGTRWMCGWKICYSEVQDRHGGKSLPFIYVCPYFRHCTHPPMPVSLNGHFKFIYMFQWRTHRWHFTVPSLPLLTTVHVLHVCTCIYTHCIYCTCHGVLTFLTCYYDICLNKLFYEGVSCRKHVMFLFWQVRLQYFDGCCAHCVLCCDSYHVSYTASIKQHCTYTCMLPVTSIYLGCWFILTGTIAFVKV